jgi:hypothetical protein
MLATQPETMDRHAVLVAVDSALLALRELDGPSTELHTAFAGPLRWSGLADVYAPPYFWAPRSRRGADGLLDEVRADSARCADKRLVWRQPWWHAELVLDRGDYERRMTAWRRYEELSKPVRPNRHLCLPLFAAYAHDIAGLSTRWAIGYTVGLRGTADKRNDDVLPRFKTARKIVEAGRRIAHTLGAWPWAEYRDGAIPSLWWGDDATLDAVRRASASLELESGRCPYPPGSQNVCIPLLPL